MRNKFLKKRTSQNSYTLICRSVEKVSISNANLCAFASQISVIVKVFPLLPVPWLFSTCVLILASLVKLRGQQAYLLVSKNFSCFMPSILKRLLACLCLAPCLFTQLCRRLDITLLRVRVCSLLLKLRKLFKRFHRLLKLFSFKILYLHIPPLCWERIIFTISS